eukprot:CAMPEP_0171639696 /NCGR_PEP_ID=MMETSP0990-20121206/29903_1 /TAXON_ID=483369 /ORGANISM="non described non described, Strain CCMP2098" /LENGTH=339 /DNA_ID=CAMNT_0012213555 /DNA_START=37 /DNA_END=1056 /DNA_ORIENTATION=-
MGGIPFENGAVAFALTFGAGMCTCLGAAVVFFPSLVHYANNKFLAGSLAVASGVMIYVSFVEIFQKSQGGFEDAGFSYAEANCYTTLCFFGGILFNKGLNELAHFVSGDAEHHGHDLIIDFDQLQENLAKIAGEEVAAVAKGSVPGPAGVGDDLGAATSEVQLSEMVQKQEETVDDEGKDDEQKPDPKLVKMGMQTALAIGIHNFPEGLATFVATLDDPLVGAGLAIAIAIHNIPEGLCVSIPIYYATHDRWEAFKWAFVSGITEPIGAAIGWAILYRVMDDIAYGIVFGLVAGMMVSICVKELLPMALKYDPDDEVVTAGFVAGMAAMALSLVLFLVA